MTDNKFQFSVAAEGQRAEVRKVKQRERAGGGQAG